VLASVDRVATVDGAVHLVVAIEGNSRLALAVCTYIIHCADALVVARFLVVQVDASIQSGAGVIGTDVVVIAVNRTAADTLLVHTLVERGALVPIVAVDFIGIVHAAQVGVAGIFGAEVAVVTVQECRCNAEPVHAIVPNGALGTVAAVALQGQELAPYPLLA